MIIKKSPPMIRKAFIPIPNDTSMIAPNIQKMARIDKEIKVARMQIDLRSCFDIPSPDVTLAKTGMRPKGSTVTKIKINVSIDKVRKSEDILNRDCT